MVHSNPRSDSGGLPVYSLEQIAAQLGGEIHGNPQVKVSGIATLANASPADLSFLSNSKYRKQLDATKAGAVILGIQDSDVTELPRIVCDNPYAYFARALSLFYPKIPETPGIHSSAIIADGSVISGSSTIAANAVIGPGATGQSSVRGAS